MTDHTFQAAVYVRRMFSDLLCPDDKELTSVEQLNAMKDGYDPKTIYDREPRVRRVVDTLIDGTFSDDNSGAFTDLHRALLQGASWHKPDNYFVLLEMLPYVERKLQANRDYQDRIAFGRKCLLNVAAAGPFSSDRTIREYADEIWHISPVTVEKAATLF